MSNAIPTPEFTPTPRPRRSSIGQGAALSSQNDASPAPDPSPAATTPPTASVPDESAAAAPPAKQGSRATSATSPRPRAASGPNGGAARTGTTTAVAEVPNKRLVGSKDVLLSLPEDLKERMLFIEAVETARCFDEGVIGSTAEANIGSIFGIGYPANTGGAAQFIDGYEGPDGKKAHGEDAPFTKVPNGLPGLTVDVRMA